MAGEPLVRRLAGAWPPRDWRDVTVLAAVSGGADSVALLRALVEAREPGTGRLVAAHFNHRLRGEASDADARFVAHLCRELDVPVAAGTWEHPEPAGGEGLEGAARRARYEFLAREAGQWGARYVAMAHTADDQAETILHRILRGTGLAGLSGIPRARRLGPATIIRPLLHVRRDEVLAYLRSLDQPYREDASNEDERFTRNRLRHDLLPKLAADYNPNVVEALLRLGRLAGEAQELIGDLAAQEARQRVTVHASGAVEIDCRGADGLPRYLLRELLLTAWRQQQWPEQSMGQEHWDALADLALADHGKRTFPGAILAEASPGCLRLWREESSVETG